MVNLDVPWSHPERKEVYEVSGQTTVPVLVDGDTMLADEYEIIDYLEKPIPLTLDSHTLKATQPK